MPVSRNRKKKNNQKNIIKAKKPRCINELFKLQTNPCRKCGGARDEFSFDELPNIQQSQWKESGMLDSVDYFLYCPSCNEYSALFKTESF